MKILQFQVGGKYEFSITYETGKDELKLQTNDRPLGNLLTAVSNVVNASINFFRFENIAAKFRKVSFSYPDNSPQFFQLEFIIKTKENVYVEHGLKTAKLALRTEDTKSTDDSFNLRINQNNSLIEYIIKLREEIESYLKGDREQTDLPFETGGDKKLDDGDDLFEDDEFDIQEGKEL